MRPAPITDEDVVVRGGRRQVMMAPRTMPDCADVETIVSSSVTYLAWELEEGDMDALQAGGRIWLAIYAFPMPPVSLGVETFG